MRVVATLSGGMASAWCADWAIKKFGKENVILYFNDTKWEHEDLYRFIDELEAYWGHLITRDTDGRDPEQVFNDRSLLGNSRIAICSRILKAERLQKFYQSGDILVFGIDKTEEHRAVRIAQVYADIAEKKRKPCTPIFPLISENVSKQDIGQWLDSIGIKRPALYDLGFAHNNCSGGCVRAGKKHWDHLRKILPEVYAERERMEEEFRFTYPNAQILKDETLQQFRLRMEKKDAPVPAWTEEDSTVVECVGICDLVT